MSDNNMESAFKNIQNQQQNRGRDSRLSRRDALKRAAMQALGLVGLFAALPAISSAIKSGQKQTEVPENNYYDYSNNYSCNYQGTGYYSYYCEDYYGYIYNKPGSPYQSYQGYWEYIYSSYCIGYYSYSKTDSIHYTNYYSYFKNDSIPYVNYYSYLNTDSIQYSSYYSGRNNGL
jgi:hypothetical protein